MEPGCPGVGELQFTARSSFCAGSTSCTRLVFRLSVRCTTKTAAKVNMATAAKTGKALEMKG